VCVNTGLDTLLTALYVFVSDRVVRRRRIGCPLLLGDAGLLCLAITVLPGFAGERHWIRYAHAHRGGGTAADRFHAGAVRHVPGDRQAPGPGRGSRVRLLRLAFPVLLGMRLYLLTSAEGMPLMWCLASPELGEREVMTAMLEAGHHLVAEGQVILADKGFAGGESEKPCTELGVHLVRPARRGSSDPALTPAERSLLRMRQLAEAVSGTLKGRL